MDWHALDQALTPDPIPPARFAELYVRPSYAPASRIIGDLTSWGARQAEVVGPVATPHFIFCGARGSGKSTELQAVQTGLVRSAEVIRVDLSFILPARSSLTQVLAFVGLALLARLREWDGSSGEAHRVIEERTGALEAVFTGFGIRATRFLDLVDALAPLVTAVVPGGEGLRTIAEVTRGVGSWMTAFRERVTGPLTPVSRSEGMLHALAGEEAPAGRELVAELSRLGAALNGLSSKPVVALVDGLDKSRSLEDLKEILADVDLLRALEVPVVFTGPTALRHDIAFAGLRRVVTPLLKFNFPVVHRDGTPREDGIGAMVRLVQVRLGRASVGVEVEAIRRAALRSSGVPRECLQFLGRAVGIAREEGATSVTVGHVDAAVKETRLMIQQAITEEDLRILEAVRVTTRIREHDRVYRMLDENLIATYPNDDTYFQPAQLLTEWVRAEADRLGSTWLEDTGPP